MGQWQESLESKTADKGAGLFPGTPLTTGHCASGGTFPRREDFSEI